MKRKQIIILLVLLLSLGIIYFKFFNNKSSDADEDHLPAVVEINPKAAALAGFEFTTVEEKQASGEMTLFAQIKANENNVFHISSVLPGKIVQDKVLLGDVVRQGQTIAVLQNVEVAKINAEFLRELHKNDLQISQARIRLSLAKKNLEREQLLFEEGISPEKDYIEAQSQYELAQLELESASEVSLHIKSEAAALLGAYGSSLSNPKSEQINSSSYITAPHSGIIAKKSVVLGEMVSPEDTLYELIDLSQVWLDIIVYPKDISKVKLGQAVIFRTETVDSRYFTGNIAYLQAQATDANQTFVARVFLDNKDLALKPGLVGEAIINTGDQEMQAVVPLAALQSYGKESFVFVVKANNRFEKRTVELGNKVSDGYFIVSGLESGEEVVTKGSFTLKAEMLKGEFAEEE
jgi:cobalt-zinc-cadmium efflux system membrane fusion protein